MKKQIRAASMRPASYNESDNSIEVVWTTGASVRRRDYRTDTLYDEVLSLAPGHVRLDRLNAGAPLLDTHDDSKLSRVIGSVIPGTARIANGVGIARVKLSTAADDAGTVGKIIDGIIRNISVGYVTHRWSVTAGSDGDAEIRTAIDWEPLEISAVPVPADAGAQFRNLARNDSPDAARARMQARQEAIAGTRFRRATVEELHAIGRTAWLTPDEFWPLVEDRT